MFNLLPNDVGNEARRRNSTGNRRKPGQSSQPPRPQVWTTSGEWMEGVPSQNLRRGRNVEILSVVSETVKLTIAAGVLKLGEKTYSPERLQ